VIVPLGSVYRPAEPDPVLADPHIGTAVSATIFSYGTRVQS
jgi:hypothetical protein